MMNFSLEKTLSTFTRLDHSLHSRIHPLTTLPVYLKRDDELSFGISGYKLRKYATLIPYLLENKTSIALLEGNFYSNSIPSLAQLLIENQIEPVAILKKRENAKPMGNGLWTSLLLPPERQILFSPENWHNRKEWIENYLSLHPNAIFLPEGGNHPAALPGALTLALDIVRNQQENTIEFAHIAVDAGTGFSAAALLIGLAYLRAKAHVHIVLTAGTKQSFLEMIRTYSQHAEKLIAPLPSLPSFTCHIPPSARSFGSTNRAIFAEILTVAQAEGVLLDPIYSAKLFLTMRKILPQLTGKTLLVHSGGAQSLFGFSFDQLLC